MSEPSLRDEECNALAGRESPEFGSIELSPELQQWVHTINLISETGSYNRFGSRIPVVSNWNCELLA